MLSRKSKFVGVLIAMMLVLSLTIPVFAQDEVEPVEEPEVVETSSKFLDHPIVKLFAEFFASFFNPLVEEEPVPDEVDGTGEDGDPGAPPPDGGDSESDGDGDGDGDLDGDAGDGGEGDEPEESKIVPEEKIASMHEENKMGFGVIAKLMELARQTRTICGDTGDFCEVTLDSLIEEYEGGMSIGALFKKYGKPENVGVGQIRKELKELNPEEKTNNGKSKNK